MNELTNREELLTQEQMAERLGVSIPAISMRLKAAGVAPAAEANRKAGVPALYSLNALIQSETELKQAGQVTRKLHQAGRVDHGKTTRTPGTFEACIWSVTDMEYATEQGWFE